MKKVYMLYEIQGRYIDKVVFDLVFETYYDAVKYLMDKGFRYYKKPDYFLLKKYGMSFVLSIKEYNVR